MRRSPSGGDLTQKRRAAREGGEAPDATRRRAPDRRGRSRSRFATLAQPVRREPTTPNGCSREPRLTDRRRQGTRDALKEIAGKPSRRREAFQLGPRSRSSTASPARAVAATTRSRSCTPSRWGYPATLRELGLNRKRVRLAATSASGGSAVPAARLRAERPNHVDPADGRVLKLLNIVDEHTRAIVAARSINADAMRSTGSSPGAERPGYIRCDNGPARLLVLRQLHRARRAVGEPGVASAGSDEGGRRAVRQPARGAQGLRARTDLGWLTAAYGALGGARRRSVAPLPRRVPELRDRSCSAFQPPPHRSRARAAHLRCAAAGFGPHRIAWALGIARSTPTPCSGAAVLDDRVSAHARRTPPPATCAYRREEAGPHPRGRRTPRPRALRRDPAHPQHAVDDHSRSPTRRPARRAGASWRLSRRSPRSAVA